MSKAINDEIRKHIGSLAKSRYQALSLNQKELSEKLGVSTRAVGYYMQGKIWPQRGVQLQLEAALGWRQGSISAAADALMGVASFEQITHAWILERSTHRKSLDDMSMEDLVLWICRRMKDQEATILRLSNELTKALKLTRS